MDHDLPRLLSLPPPRTMFTMLVRPSSSPDLLPIYVGGLHLKAHCTLPVHEHFSEILIVILSVCLETLEAFALPELFWWHCPLFFAICGSRALRYLEWPC